VPCSVFAGFTLEFALQLRKKHGKTSVRVEIVLKFLKEIKYEVIICIVWVI